jgi:hypothetical protein
MDRSSILDLVTSRYAERHGAAPTVTYNELKAESCGGRVCAALGYRRADREQLFLEAYLDAPVEQVLAQQLERPVTRGDIIEIGNLASCNATAMIGLWARTANDLGNDAEIAVAVLTAPLRKMIQRLGVSLVELAPADPARLAPDGSEWGRYYDLDPVVCAGFIAEGQERLVRFSTRLERNAA